MRPMVMRFFAACVMAMFACMAIPLETLTGGDVIVSDLAKIESEVTVDINPTNPDNLVAVGHGRLPGAIFPTMNTFYSMDGGLTWARVELGGADDGMTSDFRFDPTVAFDDDGNVYVGYGVRVDVPLQTSLVVAKSTNGGVSYSQVTVVNTIDGFPNNDKFHLAAGPDPVVPSQQNVYIAWSQRVDEGYYIDLRIVISRSTDGGASFSDPVIVNDASIFGHSPGNLFADPAVGPNGEVYVSWTNTHSGYVYVDVSFDGGVTFWGDNFVTSSDTGFKTFIPAQPDRGVYVGPTLDVDRSGGANDGRLYITYTDLGPGGVPDIDIYVQYSDDHGDSWSPRVQVNDDTGTNSQFLPWLDVDQASGIVVVVWYDARNDFFNKKVEVYLGYSTDGGNTFEPNVKVADAPSDQSEDNEDAYVSNYLEYIGVAAYDRMAHPVWSDNRVDPANLDFYTDQVDMTAPYLILNIMYYRWVAYWEKVADELDGVMDPHIVVDLDMAARDLGRSMNMDPRDPATSWKNYDIWVDAAHLEAQHGKDMFVEEKKMVNSLRLAMEHKDAPEAVKDACLDILGDVMEANRQVVSVAISEAKEMAAGWDPGTDDLPGGDASDVAEELGKAEGELEKSAGYLTRAEKEVGKGDHGKAVDHYKLAWMHAGKAREILENMES